MLKTASAVSSTNKNPEQDNQEVPVENQDEKKSIQKSYKSQKTAKSKKWIQAQKTKASIAKNLG